MRIKLVLCNLFLCFTLFNCNNSDSDLITFEDNFDYSLDEFSDIKVLRYDIPGWENLTLKEQKLVYYLTQAGLSGRDIMWDQNYRHNLDIRNALENVYRNYLGDKNSNEWLSFEIYLKRLWFSNGIHHHYSNAK
ncbi:MAG: dipeptidyl-peptidase 3 family protein, partial [Flavobacteriales bacterium]